MEVAENTAKEMAQNATNGGRLPDVLAGDDEVGRRVEAKGRLLYI